jgi:hypothetical protein
MPTDEREAKKFKIQLRKRAASLSRTPADTIYFLFYNLHFSSKSYFNIDNYQTEVIH